MLFVRIILNMDLKKKWILKSEIGEETGPFSTEELVRLIRQGSLEGTEKICLVGQNQYRPLSSYETFYDALLQALTDEDKGFEGLKPSFESKKMIEEEKTEVAPKDLIKKSAPFKQPQQISKLALQKRKPPQEALPSKDPPVSLRQKSSKRSQAPKKVRGTRFSKRAHSSRSKRVFRQKKKAMVVGFSFFVALVAVWLIFKNDSVQKTQFLIQPSFKGRALNKKEILKRLRSSLSLYYQDSYSSYQKAVSQLLPVVNGNPKRVDALALLCLVYYELIYYGEPTHKNEQVLQSLAEKSYRNDKESRVDSKVCSIVYLLVKGDVSKSDYLLNQAFTQLHQNSVPTLYYLKASVLFAQRKEPHIIIEYLQSVRKNQKNWVRPAVLEAEIYELSKDSGRALNLYRNVLKAVPKHYRAMSQMAFLEKNFLKHYDVAERWFLSIIDAKKEASAKVVAKAYLGLAEIQMVKKNSAQAKVYIERSLGAYYLKGAKKLSKKMGLRALVDEERQIGSSEDIADGDRLILEGDYQGAEALYKAAYADNPTAVAAFKAGKAVWKLGFGLGAIDWFKKAIRHDPSYVEAYVLLADLQSERYDFFAAAETLKSAFNHNPNNYEVFYGLALYEYRRGNHKAAIHNASKSVSMYEVHVPSHVLLAQIYLDVGNYNSALGHIIKSIEIDSSDIKAEAIYIKVLSRVQGLSAAEKRMRNWSSKDYPDVVEFPLALAESYYEQDYFPEALKIVEEIISSDKKVTKDVYHLYGLVLRSLGEAAAAHQAFTKATELDVSDVKSLFQTALLSFDEGRHNAAIAQFLKVQELSEFFPEVNYYIGMSLLELAKRAKSDKQKREKLLGKAFENAQKEKKKNPKVKNNYILLALIFEQKKDFKACSREYQAVIQLGVVGANVYVSAARCYRRSGNLEAAEALLNAAHTKEAGNAYIYLEQGFLSEDKGLLKDARVSFQTFLNLLPVAPEAGLARKKISELNTRIER